LYITFWSLGLYDIFLPLDSYDEEIKKTQVGKQKQTKQNKTNINES